MDDTVKAIGQALGNGEGCKGSPGASLSEAHALAFLWNGSSPWITLSDVPREPKRS